MTLRFVRCTLAVLLLALAPAAGAQESPPRSAPAGEMRYEPARTRSASSTAETAKGPLRRVVLDVEDGKIHLNGRPLDAGQRPASLGGGWPNALGQRFVFTGADASTVEINGIRYRIGPGGLTIDTDLRRAPDAVVSFLDAQGQPTLPFGSRSLILVNETAPYAAEQEYGLEVATFNLATRIRALPPGAARAALVQQLHDQLRELFDFKQAQRARELDALEAELRTLRQQHEGRSRQRESHVRRRMQDLLAQ